MHPESLDDIALHRVGSVLAVKGSLRRFAPWTAPGRSEGMTVYEGKGGMHLAAAACQPEHTIMETPNEVHGIKPMHHFEKASSECNDLYRDGYLIGAVMMSQAVAEGIWRFVLERNQIQPKKLKVGAGKKKNRPTIAAVLVKRKIISTECADAFGRIWCSFRNDVHHMNPKISKVNFPEVAKRNMADLAAIERELFAVTLGEDAGKIVLVQPRYWDLQEDGTTSGFLRNPWVGPSVGANASREDAT